jgi:hypothetical protein
MPLDKVPQTVPVGALLLPRALTNGGCMVSARAWWPGGRMAPTDRWAAAFDFSTRK